MTKSILLIIISKFKIVSQKFIKKFTKFYGQTHSEHNKLFILYLRSFLKMTQRLAFLAQKISSSKLNQVNFPVQYLRFDSLLSETQNALRKKVRDFVDKQIKNKFYQHIQKTTFPYQIVSKLKQLDLVKYFFSQPYGKKLPTHVLGIILAELSRGDAGISTFLWLESCLIGFTVQTFGSKKQKDDILPKLSNLSIIGGWALTQKNIGSDASGVQSRISKLQDKYILNGNKRWIGNGDGDILIVWAKNTQSKQIQGYIVPNKSKGLTSASIKNKLPLRMVQNCQIDFKDVEINMEQQKLEKAKGFREVNKVLKHSRLLACWISIGLGIGVYEKVIQYGSERYQFNKSILGFQLIQEKVVKIMSNLQACMFLSYRVSQMVDNQTATMGQVAMSKAYVTERVRQICKWGRQILGGNGITYDNYVMKALADIQGIYTYEGTYDINTLIAGREITGLSAFSHKQSK